MSSGSRRFHTDSRLSENFTEQGLVSLTGQSRSSWGRYVLKELLDNAIEAAQGYADPPGISVTLTATQQSTTRWTVDAIAVEDNGQGMTDEIVAEIFEDISAFGGTKRHYGLPTRGSQGNALMTILGIVSLRGQPLVIDSRGARHRIDVAEDPVSGEPRIERSTETAGHDRTRVVAGLGKSNLNLSVVEDLLAEFVALNPHVSFDISVENRVGSMESHHFEAADPSTVEWLSLSDRATTGKAPWFSFEAFKERLKADARADPSLTLDDVVSEFAKLTSRPKRNEVFGGDDHLEAIREQTVREVLKNGGDNDIKPLHQRMVAATDLFSERNLDRTLGSVGEDLFDGLLDYLRCRGDYEAVERLAEALTEYDGSISEPGDIAVYYGDGAVVEPAGMGKAVPFYFELAAIPKPSQSGHSHLVFGINQSVAYSAPTPYLEIDGESHRGMEAAFDHLGHPFYVVVNLTCPNIEFEDKGKQRFDTDPFEPVIEGVVTKAYNKLKREVRPRLNDLRRHPEREPAKLTGKAPQGFIKEFVFENFDAAYAEATDGGKYTLEVRQLYYVMRPWFEDLAAEDGYEYSANATVEDPKPLELKYGTFEDYVADYEVEELGRRVLHRDDRGFFVEPHTNRRVDLQTVDVEAYDPNLDKFGTLLFVEKQGFFNLIHQDFELTTKYDIGLINSQGYSTNAGRDLIEKVQRREDVELLILTDLDINGLGIAEDASRADTLSVVNRFESERVGVTLEDVARYGLGVERDVGYNSAQLTQLENRVADGRTDPEVAEFLKANGGQRVEINAFSPVELKDYLETKFEELGIEKVKPDENDIEVPDIPDPEDVQESAINEGIGEFVREQAEDELRDLGWGDELGENEAADELADKTVDREVLHEDILAELETFPTDDWEAVNDELAEDIEAELDELEESARESWKEAVREYLDENVTIGVSVDSDGRAD